MLTGDRGEWGGLDVVHVCMRHSWVASPSRPGDQHIVGLLHCGQRPLSAKLLPQPCGSGLCLGDLHLTLLPGLVGQGLQ